MVPTLFILILIASGYAANPRGVNSIDGLDSPKWERDDEAGMDFTNVRLDIS